MANIKFKPLKEEMYTIIDPRGNPGPIAPKHQVVAYAKKKGGNKKGYFVIPSKNIKKAQKLYGRYGGDFGNSKLQDKMSDMYWEGINEGKLNEATKPITTTFVKGWEKMVDFLQAKMEEYKKNPNIKKNNTLHGMANGAYNNMNTVKGIPAQWLKIDKMIGEGVNEAAPKMKNSKEEKEFTKLFHLVANQQKGGSGNRYGKEFDKAKTKALRAMKDMLTYIKIGV